jgi:hypothetical protein
MSRPITTGAKDEAVTMFLTESTVIESMQRGYGNR